MIVARLVKELFVSSVHLHVVLRCGHLEVRDPCELSVNIALFPAQRTPGGHAGASDCVLFIRIKGFFWSVCDNCLLLMFFVKILL